MLPFLSSASVKVGIILAVIFGIFSSGYLLGKRMSDQTALVEALKRDSADLVKERDALVTERDEVVRLAKAANEIAIQSAVREREVQAEKDELEGMVRDYESHLAKAKDRSCGFTADDVVRLRAIYERAFGALHAGTPPAPGVDGGTGEDRSAPVGR